MDTVESIRSVGDELPTFFTFSNAV